MCQPRAKGRRRSRPRQDRRGPFDSHRPASRAYSLTELADTMARSHCCQLRERSTAIMPCNFLAGCCRYVDLRLAAEQMAPRHVPLRSCLRPKCYLYACVLPYLAVIAFASSVVFSRRNFALDWRRRQHLQFFARPEELHHQAGAGPFRDSPRQLRDAGMLAPLCETFVEPVVRHNRHTHRAAPDSQRVFTHAGRVLEA